MKLRLFCLAALTTTSALRAQVGHLPARTPYADLDRKHEITLLAGQHFAAADPAGVAPGSGLITGLQYEWRASGPAHLVAEFSRIGSRRNPVNPSLPMADRVLGARSWPLYSADVSLGLSLTGARSWHSLVPMARLGLGVISDLKTGTDEGGYRFGTRFALLAGTGVRWVSRGNLQVRTDITDRVFTIEYPTTYYSAPPGDTPLLTTRQEKKRWTHNPAVTLGVSYFFSR